MGAGEGRSEYIGNERSVITWSYEEHAVKHLIVGLVLVGALSVPREERAQIFGGLFGAWAQDAFDGTAGVGAQFGLDISILPVDVYGSGTWFLPNCDDCKMKGWSLGVALRPFLFLVARSADWPPGISRIPPVWTWTPVAPSPVWGWIWH